MFPRPRFVKITFEKIVLRLSERVCLRKLKMNRDVAQPSVYDSFVTTKDDSKKISKQNWRQVCRDFFLENLARKRAFSNFVRSRKKDLFLQIPRGTWKSFTQRHCAWTWNFENNPHPRTRLLNRANSCASVKIGIMCAKKKGKNPKSAYKVSADIFTFVTARNVESASRKIGNISRVLILARFCRNRGYFGVQLVFCSTSFYFLSGCNGARIIFRFFVPGYGTWILRQLIFNLWWKKPWKLFANNVNIFT